MMRHILLLCGCLYLAGTSAQDKYDYTWLLGYPPYLPEEMFGGSTLDFSHEPVQVTYGNIGLELSTSTAVMCNKEGQLLFYANGCKIYNSLHQLIQGGDSLNASGKELTAYCRFNHGYFAFPGMLALPLPSSIGRYVLLHYRFADPPLNDEYYGMESLLCTEIDMSANAGRGRVLSKNVVLKRDTFFDDSFAAVRHGNGRDWWISSFRLDADKVFLWLLTPEGIQGPFERQTGLHWNANSIFYARTSSAFSPDGRRFARVGENNNTQLFRFNRCSGDFSEPVTLTLPGDTIFTGTLAFSPNGRFLYVNTNFKLFQFDCEAPDIQSSKTLIGVYDGFVSEVHFATTFYHMRQAPDGKIYMSATNGVPFLHVIHEPNAKGMACRFEQRGLSLPSYNGFSLPLFPNYRLYDQQDSPCDTLGIDGPAVSVAAPPQSGSPRIAPNPANQFTALQFSEPFSGEITLRDARGGLLRHFALVQERDLVISVEALPPGLYYLQGRTKQAGGGFALKLSVAK